MDSRSFWIIVHYQFTVYNKSRRNQVFRGIDKLGFNRIFCSFFCDSDNSRVTFYYSNTKYMYVC